MTDTTTTPLACQREAFDLPEGLAYLNTAYMGPLPRVTVAAAQRALTSRVSPSGIGADAFFLPAERARVACAALVKADPEQVALVTSTAQAIAIAVDNLDLAPGTTIVVPGEQFPSNVLGWRRLGERGIEIRTVPRPRPEDTRSDGRSLATLWNERLLAAIDSRCAIVAVEPGHWTDGARFDLDAIAARAHQVGAALVIDATQYVGVHPFDVTRLKPDLFVAHAYKSMLSHYGLGFAVLGPRLARGRPLDEHWMLRRDAENFSGLVDYQEAYAGGVRRFDTNVRANGILVESLAASASLLGQWQPARVADYCRRLMDGLDERFRALGFGLAPVTDRLPNLFGLQAPAGRDLEALRRALDARQVQVSIRGTSLRVSLHAFNRRQDLEALLDALASS